MSALDLRYRGAWSALSTDERESLSRRDAYRSDTVRLEARAIVEDVRVRGDAALRELALRFDGVRLDSLEVGMAECRRALDALDGSTRGALERAATNIASVHDAFRPVAACARPEPGIVIRRRPDPLGSVGVYAPGGRASYPSSVLMAAIPAKVAGVGTLVLASPPDRTGKPAAIVLAAAALAGVDRVFAIGGAGAVGAMACGTETIPRVDRIVGPGNAYVAAAKLLVADRVGIDSPAGPSELVVIADDTSNPRVVATEMVAQAEHDPDAVVVAIAVGSKVARVVEAFLADAVARAARIEIVLEALRRRGGILVARDRAEAIAAANDIAAEHLLLAVSDAESLASAVRNAGSVFVGASASVAFGDYMTGANHVLPTGGSARAYSGLSPLDFVRWMTFQSVEPDAAARLAGDVATLARAEGLPGHAAAALQWSAR